MSKLTITEGLAELKVIDKRISKKTSFISNHLYRQDQLKDPLSKDGGQQVVIAKERQSIGDLEQRAVDIRMAINKANENTSIAVEGITRTIAEWLIWRRDVAPGHQRFLGSMNQAIQSMRREAQQKGIQIASGDTATDTDIHVNIDEYALAEEIELLETIFETLDGQLSLKNATTFIEL